MSEEERAPHVTKANTLLQEYKGATKKFKEGMVGRGMDGSKESLNMNNAEEKVNTTKAAASVHSGQVDVERAEADSDEKAD